MKLRTGLTNGNISVMYPHLGHVVDYEYLGGKALLQKDYGKPLDCTLTCLAFIFGAKYYGDIEAIAETLFYNGETHGTLPITIKAIMKRVMKLAGVKGVPKSAYMKGIGFTWKKIKQLVREKHYVVLNIWKDGRNYYNDHSVTIVGFAEYKDERFLLVYDNWSTDVSYLDFNALNPIASINWYE